MVVMKTIVTMATERVINISQYKAAAVSHLIIDISAILRPTKPKFRMKMHLHRGTEGKGQAMSALALKSSFDANLTSIPRFCRPPFTSVVE